MSYPKQLLKNVVFRNDLKLMNKQTNQIYCLQKLVWPVLVHSQKSFTSCFTVMLEIICNPLISQVYYECLRHL